MNLEIAKMLSGPAVKVATKVGHKLVEHAPEIMTISGVIFVGSGTVLACKNTPDVCKIMEIHKKHMDIINGCTESGVDAEGESYSIEKAKTDKIIVYKNTLAGIAKKYAPPAAIILTGLGLMVGANIILKDRNTALATAFAGMSTAFAEYRNRVANTIGVEKEQDVCYDIERIKVTEEIEDPETGKTKKVKTEKRLLKGDISEYSPFARVFDDASRHWDKSPEYNFMQLKASQEYFNNVLRTKGVVLVNDIYDALDIPRTEIGSSWGWHYDPHDPKYSDVIIDFGLYRIDRPAARDFMNGYENCFILDLKPMGKVTQFF